MQKDLKDLAVVVNTHSSCTDVWPMFFGQLEKHLGKLQTYVFTNNEDGLPDYVSPVLYKEEDKYRTQYLNCLKSVREPFILHLNEDYILYNDVDFSKIRSCLQVLATNRELCCVRFTRGPNFTNDKFRDGLHYLTHDKEYFFSQTAGLWNKDLLEKIHELGPDTHIGVNGAQYGHFEEDANRVCKDLNLTGLIAYNDEPLRHNAAHHDSSIFPYIATAIVKGKWNLSEYSLELLPLLEKYNIDPTRRGVY